MTLTIIIIILLLGLSGFFSGSETALTATSEARMRTLEDQGNKRASRVTKLIGDKESLIGAILLGNNLVNILASALATSLITSVMPGSGGIAAATAIMTILVLVFSEVMPKTAAIARPEKFAMFVSPVMTVVVKILSPITAVVQFIVRNTLRTFGLNVSEDGNVLSATEELRGAIDLHHEGGRVDKDTRDVIRGALELDDIRVDEIMVHRKSMQMIDIARPSREVIEEVLDSQYTRIPLWRDDPDNVVGVLHAKDLLRALWEAGNDPTKIRLSRIARKPYFIPETTTLQEQLDMFQANQLHFALVVDEYGALQGLVTLEDILEEVVGEIEDEYDAPVQGVRIQSDGSLHVDGDVTIRDLNRSRDFRMPDEEAVTVAGLVIHESQSIPEIGQIFSFHGFQFEILKRHRNQITLLRVTPLAPTEDTPS